MKEVKYSVKVDNLSSDEKLEHITIATRNDKGRLFYTRLFPEDVQFIEILKLEN